MTRTRIMIVGAGGRMGKLIAQAAISDPSLQIVSGTETHGSSTIGRDIGENAGMEKIGVPISESAESAMDSCEVVIDFTIPDAAVKILGLAAQKGKKIVVGTTGFSESQIEMIKKTSQKTAVVFSPNMSTGMNLLFRLVEEAAKVLGDYDIEIIEAHHKHKKDAPSGTAVRIAEIVAQTLGRDLKKDGVYGRHGIVGERKNNEIGIHAVRAGDIVGDHTVLFCTDGERLELRHQAHSRMTFAMGALRAAKFLADKQTGLYTMKEVLGL